ncbi:MAG: thiosulfate/3-mercaptopyruvate sulfurtransferase [Cocleimonas sp.]|jgi:thiosulfate/3-mercaptopyruvate sulfurtransferase
MYYQTIVSAEILSKNIKEPDNQNWVILDCRDSLMDKEFGYKSYLEGHIPSASYCYLYDDFSSPITPTTGRHPLPDMEKLSEKLGNWGIGKDTQVVVYDDMSGAFAGRMWWQLRSLGHQNVAALDGGLKYWLSQDLPLSTEIPDVASKQFNGTLDSNQLITVEQVESNLEDNNGESSFSLLDARAAPRYRGDVEPIDPIAGHVPDALNRDFSANLDEQGLFLSASSLKEQFQPIVEQANNQHIVHMCGSGVTACHNMLAMEIAGLSGSQLYLGSWSQWITDPSRTIATG